MSQAQITGTVCHTYTAAGIQLVMIDEVHRLASAPPPVPRPPT
ncbi:hypothetical protein [Streptomyces tubercidicus]